MTLPYKARLNEQTFLNLPGFNGGGAYVYAFVEDTDERGLGVGPLCEPDCTCGWKDNFEPRLELSISDGDDVVNLGFAIESDGYRENSLHKLDTLIAALRVFRAALMEEFEPYDRRSRELFELEGGCQDEPPDRGCRREPRSHDTVAEWRGTRLQSAYTAVRVCPVSFLLGADRESALADSRSHRSLKAPAVAVATACAP